MATYTDNYQLTKPLYSETADVAAINNNMDKIDDIMHASQVSLAPAYDQNETYNTGDVVMYEFLMYECLEDDVTGVWDATKWQRTTAGEHGGGSAASEVSYDNTNSGLEADNVQDALDEIVENIPREEITGEASGAIASFTDGSTLPMKKLEVAIEPQQDLHGYENPWVGGSGKNKCPINSGTITVGNFVTFSTPLPNGTYSISLKATRTPSSGSYASLVPYDKDGVAYSNVIGIAPEKLDGSIVKAEAREFNNGLSKIYVYSLAGNWSDSRNYTLSISNLQIEQGNTATAFIPYSNICPISGWSSVEVTVADDTTDPTTEETYEITLGQTVYGGKLNVTTGELTVDRVIQNLGDLTWTNYKNGGFRAALTNSINNTATTNLSRNICSQYKTQPSSATLVSGEFSIAAKNIYVADGRFTTDETAFKTAMSGVQLVYELATPITISLTPTQVSSLLGSNNIWADSGDSDVVYVRDIDKAFNILWDAVMNSNSGTRRLNLMKGAISETKEDIEEPIKEEEETKEGNDENQR